MRRDRNYLLDIIRACRNVEALVSGRHFEEFIRDGATFSRTVGSIREVGESLRRMPDTTLNLEPELKRASNLGLDRFSVGTQIDGDVLYRAGDFGAAWVSATDLCPKLLAAAERALALLPEE